MLTVHVDRGPVEVGLAGLALCAVRHGVLERVELTAAGETVEIAPIPRAAARSCSRREPEGSGAATARSVIEAIGGSLTLEGERLLVLLPA